MSADMAALRRAKLDMNDTGNARRMIDQALGRLYWVDDHKAWVAFDGVRFSLEDGDGAAGAFAMATMDAIFDEVQALHNAESDQLSSVFGTSFTSELAKARAAELYGWAVKSGDMARINGMLKAAASLRRDGVFPFRARLDQFDADPLAYHCANGVLRFGQGSDGVWRHHFTPGHDPADMFMQVAAVAYDAKASAPEWAKRLEIMHSDPVQRTALQRIWGSTLTALTSDQAFYVFQGKGQDGKSTSNAVIGAMHGDYFLTASPKTFLEGPAQAGSAHQSDIVRLRGDVRMVVADEPKRNSTWDGERIKQVTGSRIVARGVNAKTEITYRPHWKLIVECNQLPKAPSDDRGFRRRFKLTIWRVQFGITPGVPDDPVHEVEARLAREQSGILNWMIEGAIDWLREQTIPEPELSARARDSFWENASRLSEFLESQCDMSDPDARTNGTELYKAFRQFCLDQGDAEDRIMKQAGFGTKLNDIQIYVEKNSRTGLKDRVGIRLRAAGEVRAPLDTGPVSVENDGWPGARDFGGLEGFD